MDESRAYIDVTLLSFLNSRISEIVLDESVGLPSVSEYNPRTLTVRNAIDRVKYMCNLQDAPQGENLDGEFQVQFNGLLHVFTATFREDKGIATCHIVKKMAGG
jgi:hypothetical protein